MSPPLLRIASALFAASCCADAAGAAQACITPAGPQPLAGYSRDRLSTGVHDDLWENALVPDDGAARFAPAACGVSETPAAVADKARKLAGKQTSTPGGDISISTAPRMARTSADWASGRMAASASAAGASGGKAAPVSNRRHFMTGGTAGWSPGKRNPCILRPASPVDPRVPAISVDSESGAPTAALGNYALPVGTVGGTELPADHLNTLPRRVSGARVGGEQLPFLDIVQARRILGLESRSEAPCEAEVEVIAASGGVAWVGLPGEIFVEPKPEIQPAPPFRRTVSASPANGSFGCIPDWNGWKEGNHEALTARCAGSGGERPPEAALSLLQEVKP